MRIPQLIPVPLCSVGCVWRGVTIGVLMSVVGHAATAQDRWPWFGSAAFGAVHQDRHGNEQLPQNGLFLQVHGGRHFSRALAVRVDVLHSSIRRNDEVVFVSCAALSAGCPSSFSGPVRLLGIAAGLEASWIDRNILLTTSIGPGGYWLTSRPPGAREFSIGLRWTAGGGFRIAPHVFVTTGLEYYRLFTNDGAPRWMLPLVAGIELR
jgi:hypothetical protein